jgi:hypothetical protein
VGPGSGGLPPPPTWAIEVGGGGGGGLAQASGSRLGFMRPAMWALVVSEELHFP